MNKYIAVALALLLAPAVLFAQRSTTQGTQAPQGGSKNKQPLYTLTIQVNPSSAMIFIDGESLKGRNAAGLRAGTYRITVRADGYQDFTTTVNLNSDMTLPVNLQSMNYQLQVNVSNVAGAQVLINGGPAGQAPFNAALAPGSYSIIIRAPGFLDYTENFVLNGSKVINVSLQPMTATYQVRVNAANINPDDQLGSDRSVRIYVDGILQQGMSGQLMPGRRLVRVVSGGLQAENFIDVQVGRTYIFEPYLGVNIR